MESVIKFSIRRRASSPQWNTLIARAREFKREFRGTFSLVHGFSCTYNKLLINLESLESTQEAIVGMLLSCSENFPRARYSINQLLLRPWTLWTCMSSTVYLWREHYRTQTTTLQMKKPNFNSYLHAFYNLFLNSCYMNEYFKEPYPGYVKTSPVLRLLSLSLQGGGLGWEVFTWTNKNIFIANYLKYIYILRFVQSTEISRYHKKLVFSDN